MNWKTRKQAEIAMYKKHIDLTIERLNITREDYELFKRLGNTLRKIYVDQCNGFQTADFRWDEVASRKSEEKEGRYVKRIKSLALQKNLYLFLQTDPRGATVYLSKTKIRENDYNRDAQCIY